MLTKDDIRVLLSAMQGRARIHREAEALRIARGAAPALVENANQNAAAAEAIAVKLRALFEVPQDFATIMLTRLRKVAEFVGDEADNRMEAGSHMSDYENEATDALNELNGVIDSLGRLWGISGDFTHQSAETAS